MNANSQSDTIILHFLSYASITFKIELYASELLIDWGNGTQTAYHEPSGYYNIRYRDLPEGMQKVRITGRDISYLKASRLNITDLILENCPSLEYLDCSGNELCKLDISKCTALEELYCNSNNLSRLYIPDNNKLTQINISYNNLQKINISNCTALHTFYCACNNLIELKIAPNIVINDINIYNNQLDTKSLNNIVDLLPFKNRHDFALIHLLENPGTEEYNSALLCAKNWH